MLCRPCSSSSETHDEASDAIPNVQVTAVISEDIASNKAQAPVQPTIQLPTSVFGKSSRSFQAKWYTDHKWLEYSKQKDAAFCFACRFFSSAAEAAFTEIGFRDWKHACGKDGILTCHAKSKPHKAAMLNWEEYQKRAGTDTTISLQFDRMGQQVITENRQYVVAIMEAILYCAQQGIPLRGHDEGDDASNPGNFKSLMKLLSRHSLILKQRVQEGAKKAFATHNGIEVEKERPKRLSRTPLVLQHSIITAQSTGNRETPVNHYRVQVYYQTIDSVLAEMRSRFSSLNMELLKAVDSLRPNSPHFLDTVLLAPFLQHYGIDLEEVNSECMNARNFFMRDPPSGNQLHDILEKLNPALCCFSCSH